MSNGRAEGCTALVGELVASPDDGDFVSAISEAVRPPLRMR
jgi:hypothetical protein